METRKGRTRRQKLTAVVLADATTVMAASLATGIPRSTLRHWIDDPELAVYRQNARDAVADEVRVVARLAWEKLADALRANRLEPRDLVMAAGMAMDKTQLLDGRATSRSESRDLTDTLDDHERESLRDAIREQLARQHPDGAAEGDPAEPAVAGAET